MDALRDLDVVVLDCQTTGASPELGDLLELGWTIARAGSDEPVRAHWIVPRSGKKVPRIVRRLTGFDDGCLATALAPERGWSMLREDASRVGDPAKTVIHFARFELSFLRDLHARAGGDAAAFPFEAVCLHAVAQRLFPQLPRRSLRALAGMHGFAADLVRRSEGHVKATAFLWRALVPKLEAAGVRTWPELRAWLDEPAPKRGRRAYPLPADKRKHLPSGPGIYRFLRSNGDVLYVGKAASIKKRVASHFGAPSRATERALEMLTQVSDIATSRTASALEAALLEADEIKRLAPPYNVQFLDRDGRAWFSSRDLGSVAPAPDDAHPYGPLPSRRAVSPLGAIAELASGAEPTREARARAVGVPVSFTPDAATFDAAWSAFAEAHLARAARRTSVALDRASRALWLVRADLEDGSDDDAPPSGWDAARVRRHLDRALLRGGQLLRRARWLCILVDSVVVFREADDILRRVLVIERGEIASAGDREPDAAPSPSRWRARQASFDRARYDRLRVLSTELARIHGEGGDVAVRVGRHRLAGERLARILRWV